MFMLPAGSGGCDFLRDVAPLSRPSNWRQKYDACWICWMYVSSRLQGKWAAVFLLLHIWHEGETGEAPRGEVVWLNNAAAA